MNHMDFNAKKEFKYLILKRCEELKYQREILFYIIYSDDQEDLINYLYENMPFILNTFLNIEYDINYLQELNDYACIFVNNEKYIDIYNTVCLLIKNITKDNYDLDWISSPVLPPILLHEQ